MNYENNVEMNDDRYSSETATVTNNECLCCRRGRVYPWRIKVTDEFVWVCNECDFLWKEGQEFLEENATDVSERYFQNAYPDGISGIGWETKVEELPYVEIFEDIRYDNRFPPEATGISLCNSNRFFVFECSIPNEVFSEWMHKQRYATACLEHPDRIPRYRLFVSELKKRGSAIEANFPDEMFYDDGPGIEYRIRYRSYFKHVVFDIRRQRMYQYEIYGLASNDKLTSDALHLHALLYPGDILVGVRKDRPEIDKNL